MGSELASTLRAHTSQNLNRSSSKVAHRELIVSLCTGLFRPHSKAKLEDRLSLPESCCSCCSCCSCSCCSWHVYPDWCRGRFGIEYGKSQVCQGQPNAFCCSTTHFVASPIQQHLHDICTSTGVPTGDIEPPVMFDACAICPNIKFFSSMFSLRYLTSSKEANMARYLPG